MKGESVERALDTEESTVDPIIFTPAVSRVAGQPVVARNADLLREVTVQIEVRLGEATASVQDVFEWKDGTVIALARSVDDPVDLLLNGRVIARGQLVASGDQFGVRITEIQDPTA